MKLTDEDISHLRWMVRCNADGIGFLGPTVRKRGHLPELHNVVYSGLAELRKPLVGSSLRGGYWITVAGRRALDDLPLIAGRAALADAGRD